MVFEQFPTPPRVLVVVLNFPKDYQSWRQAEVKFLFLPKNWSIFTQNARTANHHGCGGSQPEHHFPHSAALLLRGLRQKVYQRAEEHSRGPGGPLARRHLREHQQRRREILKVRYVVFTNKMNLK